LNRKSQQIIVVHPNSFILIKLYSNPWYNINMKLLSSMLSLAVFFPWSALALNTVKVGDKVPFANLHWGFPPQMINTAQHVMGRSVLVVGLPGAFTPT
jgi:hypothetical protein